MGNLSRQFAVLGMACLLGLGAPLPAQGADAFDKAFGPPVHEIELPLILDIGLQEGQKKVRFQAPSNGVLSQGDRQIPIAAGSELEVRWVEGVPAEVLTMVCIATFEAEQYSKGLSQMTMLRAQGIPARLEPAGGRLVLEGGRQVHDHRRAFMVVEETTDLEEAEALKQAWIEKGERPFFHEILLGNPKAKLQVRRGNQVLTQGWEAVGFRATGGRFLVRKVEFGQNEPWHGFEDREYRGLLSFRPDRSGTIATVNTVELETYLRGVVPSEISPSSPIAALRSQAVAARGETLAKYRLRHSPDPYHLCAWTHCQVYGGITKEVASTNQAVLDTKSEVMQRSGKIVDAVYGAVCGGHSEHNENVWTSPTNPALRGVADGKGLPSPVTDANLEAFLADRSKAWCKKAPGDRFRWTRSFTAQELSQLLAKAKIQIGSLKAIETGPRGVSGRLKSLVLVGTKGRYTIRKELPIRRKLGNLRSALFAVDQTRNSRGILTKATFRGAGWGHGVGLCQVGARAQAEAGVAYKKILSHYYTGVTVRAVDADPEDPKDPEDPSEP